MEFVIYDLQLHEHVSLTGRIMPRGTCMMPGFAGLPVCIETSSLQLLGQHTEHDIDRFVKSGFHTGQKQLSVRLVKSCFQPGIIC